MRTAGRPSSSSTTISPTACRCPRSISFRPTSTPSRIDPVTAKPEEPILMFDQLIVHAGKFAKELDPFARARRRPKPRRRKFEEVEIYEYRQLQQQLAWLKQHYPNRRRDHGPEGAHDQRSRSPHLRQHDVRDDAERRRPIRPSLFVPFYGQDDKLVGSVTAIILSRALRGHGARVRTSLSSTGPTIMFQSRAHTDKNASPPHGF